MSQTTQSPLPATKRKESDLGIVSIGEPGEEALARVISGILGIKLVRPEKSPEEPQR